MLRLVSARRHMTPARGRLRPLLYVPRRWMLGYAPAFRAGERGWHHWSYADRRLMRLYGGLYGETQ